MLERSLNAPTTERRKEVGKHQHPAPRALHHRLALPASKCDAPFSALQRVFGLV